MSVIKKYSYWIKSGQYTTIQKLATLVSGILSFAMLARMLGAEGFGTWGLFLTIAGIIETARTALVKNAFIRFSGQLKEGETNSGLQAGALMLSTGISIIWSLVLLIFAGLVAEFLKADSLRTMLLWYAFTVFISVVFTHCEILMNARMDFRTLCWMYVVRQGVLVCLIFALYFTRIQITATVLSIIYLFSVLAGTIVGWLLSRRFIQFDFATGKQKLPALIHYGKFVFGNNMSSLLFRSTDNFVTSNFFGPGIAGFYNASLRISNLVDMPSQVLGDVLFPRAAKFKAEDIAAVKNSYEKTVGATLIFSIPALAVLLIFPELILTILAGDKFIEAAPILRITAFFGFTLPFIKQFGTIMDATGSPDLNFKVMLFAFLVNIVTNIIGVHLFGILGSAIGTATTYFLVLIITQQILHRKFGIQWTNVFRNSYLLTRELLSSAKPSLK